MRYFNWIVLLLLLTFPRENNAKKKYESQNMDPIDSSRLSLPSSSNYDEIFEVTDNNHEEMVMESEDPWIIIYYKSNIQKKWIQHSKYINGGAWYGKVDVNQNHKLAKLMKFDDVKINYEGGIAVIYPLSSSKKKQLLEKGDLPKVTEPALAESFLSEFVPDATVELDFLPKNMEKFNEWIVSSYYKSTIAKFPIICVYDGTKIPLVVKSIEHYFKSHFAFAAVPKLALPNMLKIFKEVPYPKTFPMFYLLLGREPSSEEMNRGIYNMHFNVFPFIEDKYGDGRKFYSLVNYLFVANQDYRSMLPGKRADESTSISQMKSIKDQLNLRVNNILRHQNKNNQSIKSEL